LGIEFTLAAITACALNGCDLYKSGKRIEEKIATLSHDETVSAEKKQTIAHAYAKEQTEISSEKDRNIICLALSFIAFLYVGTVHKKWAVGEDGWKKKAKLGIEANVYGYVASVVYLLWVKGIW